MLFLRYIINPLSPSASAHFAQLTLKGKQETSCMWHHLIQEVIASILIYSLSTKRFLSEIFVKFFNLPFKFRYDVTIVMANARNRLTLDEVLDVLDETYGIPGDGEDSDIDSEISECSDSVI